MWHKDLIPVLPQKQLIAQWRELCCIIKNIMDEGIPNHLLVNKVLDFPAIHFLLYTNRVLSEMQKRGIKINEETYLKFCGRYEKSFGRFNNENLEMFNDYLYQGWHNERYLKQCYYNLQEKYDCGGITETEWNEIEKSFGGRENE